MNLKIVHSFLAALCAAAVGLAQAPPPSAEQNQEANIKAYVDLLRKDIRKEKVAILTEMLELTPEDSAKFWPVYNEYDKELTVLADQRIAFIRMYAENYGSFTNEKVTQVATGLLDVQLRRDALQKKYFLRMCQAMNPKLAARFLQVEHQMLLILDLQIASNLPVVQ